MSGEPGRSGRPPTPTKLKVLRGTTRPDRMNPDEPQLKPKLPRALPHLSKRAKAIWKRMGGILLVSGIVTALDEVVFGVYCQGQADIEQLEREIRREGMVFVNPNTEHMARNPKTIVLKETYERTMKAAMQLGLTPSARTRVSSLTKKAKTENEFWS